MSTVTVKKQRYLIRQSDVSTYQPANHNHTTNQRIIDAETVGAKHMEVIIGVLDKQGGATAHSHAGIEQTCHVLEGTAHVQVGDESFDMVPGDTCFFPANVIHTFTGTSESPTRVLVIYSPPLSTQGHTNETETTKTKIISCNFCTR